MIKKEDKLVIRGAKTHNLKNISLSIPKNKLVVFTGVSGSGKSSLAFDTIYSEGQRRYVESLMSYARQFLGVMDKPDVESIDGISPAIAIDQKTISKNPRSTVGTITEIYDYLRILFVHSGTPYCPNGHGKIESQSVSNIVERVKQLQGSVMILAPLIVARKGEHRGVLQEAANSGFLRVRMNGISMLLDEALSITLDPQKKHTIDIVVDRMEIDDEVDEVRLFDSLETALKIGKGVVCISQQEDESEAPDIVYSENLACHQCGFSMRDIEPRSFSFNSPYGACDKCSGLGSQMEVDPALVMPNENLSLAEGAVKPWSSTTAQNPGRQGWYYLMLQRMTSRYNIDVNVPVKQLSQKVKDLILYGGDEFEGVVQNLERRHKATDSEWMRGEIEKYMNITDCPECSGMRLRPESLSVRINDLNIYEISCKSISAAQKFFTDFSEDPSLSKSQKAIVQPILKEIISRLGFLEKVGLEYLTLNRASATLSGGEGQRIRLATQLGSRLSGVFYILDEPSIGLHSRDQKRLVDTMKELRDLGNSVLVVEHDELTIREADWIVDIGPGAGKYGGEVLFEGTPQQLLRSRCLTGQYLSGKKKVEGISVIEQKKKSIPRHIQRKSEEKKGKMKECITIQGAREHNLKDIDVVVPLNKFVVVSGVSGSGKSSLVNDILAKYVLRELHNAHTIPGEHSSIQGLEYINKAIVIDQAPIGRTPRSNPATYTGVFSNIRELFASTQEAKARGYLAGRFSFNVKGGRCEVCSGGGVKKIEMFFLPDVYVECDACDGRRYNKEALDILYNGKNIADVLDMTIEEAYSFFENIPFIATKLDVLRRVGLGYIELGQGAPSLSGGEAQRVKLATELARRDTGKTLYILDEPTTGMHFEDVNNLLGVLKGLVRLGNSVLVIEHNIDMIQNADWIIDLGPGGGDAGGTLVAQGTPSDIAKEKASETGAFLVQR